MIQSQHKAAVSAGVYAAVALIGHQVAGKAVRDTLFLSEYDVTNLPLMLIVASVASLLTVLMTGRAMSRLGPQRLVPWAFAVSAVLQVGWWGLSFVAPGIAAVAVYLHMTMFGAVLISGFWSLVNERFDPRTAKKVVAQIAAGGTFGGLLGGVLAERLSALSGVHHVLLALGALHVFCGWRVRALGSPNDQDALTTSEQRPDEHLLAGFAILARSPFLRNIGLMVMLGTLSAALMDYVFKVEATAAYQHDEAGLMRVFAWFYTATGILTFIVQTTLSGRALERLGIARSMAAMPLIVSVGAFATLLFPGLWVAAASRGGETVLRSSIFRSAYELLYTPVPPGEKRQAKTLIDVGFDRLGDALGGLLVTGVIYVAASEASVKEYLLIGAVLLGLLGVTLAFRLHSGYVKALEISLINRAVELDLAEVQDATTRSTLMSTLASQGVDRLALEAALRSIGEGAQITFSQLVASSELSEEQQRHRQQHDPHESVDEDLGHLDPTVQALAALRSGELHRVQRALHDPVCEDLALAHQLIQLLAWDEVFPHALRRLRRLAPLCTGQMTDALLNPEEAFAVRRRLPRALTAGDPERALAALVKGLGDRRFEVRYQCGVGLSKLTQRDEALKLSPEDIYAVIRKETRVGRRVWASQRLLDQMESLDGELPFVDEFIKDRTDRSLQHVFTLLSLILPRQPLIIAYRGLHTDDPTLKGTALEYLESVLPPDIRAPLLPLLEDPRPETRANRSRSEVLDELVNSNESIQLNLEALRARLKAEDPNS